MTTFSRADFWGHPEKWPTFDPPGYVFLARAVGEVGRALFGDEWTGAEPGQDLIHELPRRRGSALPWQVRAAWALRGRLRAKRRAQMSEEERAEADRLLKEHNQAALKSEGSGRYGQIGALYINPPPSPALFQPSDFTDEEWLDSWRLNEADRQEQAPKLARWAQVQREIARGCLEGKLGFALRMDNGEMWLGQPAWWNNDRWAPRFTLCEMNPSDLTSTGIAGANFRKIFLTRESLDTFIARLSAGGEQPSAAWAPSPGQTLKEWCVQPGPEAEARKRARAVFANPSDKTICEALAVMWGEAGRGAAKAKTIEQYRVAHRTGSR